MHSIIPLFPGLPGGPELLIVLFVLVLLFGANKIPKLARSTGQAMGEFRRGREEIEEELNEVKEGGSTSEPTEPTTGATPTEDETEEESTEKTTEKTQ